MSADYLNLSLKQFAPHKHSTRLPHCCSIQIFYVLPKLCGFQRTRKLFFCKTWTTCFWSERKCVYCTVRTGCVNMVWVDSSLQKDEDIGASKKEMLFWKTWSTGQTAVCSMSIHGCCCNVTFKKGFEVHRFVFRGNWPERNAENLLPTESVLVSILVLIKQFRWKGILMCILVNSVPFKVSYTLAVCDISYRKLWQFVINCVEYCEFVRYIISNTVTVYDISYRLLW